MAHPTKLPKNKDGVIEVPTLYDISGSANFFNKADFGIVVHRDRINNTTEVHVQKVKFKHLGECGTAIFKYNLNNGRYVPYNGNNEVDWDNTNHLLEMETKKIQQAMEESVSKSVDISFNVRRYCNPASSPGPPKISAIAVPTLCALSGNSANFAETSAIT